MIKGDIKTGVRISNSNPSIMFLQNLILSMPKHFVVADI